MAVARHVQNETFENSRIRVLRALTHFDEVEASELLDALGEDPESGIRAIHTSSLSWMVRMGLVTARTQEYRVAYRYGRPRYAKCRLYTLTQAGREWLMRRLRPDLAVAP